MLHAIYPLFLAFKLQVIYAGSVNVTIMPYDKQRRHCDFLLLQCGLHREAVEICGLTGKIKAACALTLFNSFTLSKAGSIIFITWFITCSTRLSIFISSF